MLLVCVPLVDVAGRVYCLCVALVAPDCVELFCRCTFAPLVVLLLVTEVPEARVRPPVVDCGSLTISVPVRLLSLETVEVPVLSRAGRSLPPDIDVLFELEFVPFCGGLLLEAL